MVTESRGASQMAGQSWRMLRPVSVLRFSSDPDRLRLVEDESLLIDNSALVPVSPLLCMRVLSAVLVFNFRHRVASLCGFLLFDVSWVRWPLFLCHRPKRPILLPYDRV